MHKQEAKYITGLLVQLGDRARGYAVNIGGGATYVPEEESDHWSFGTLNAINKE